MMLCVIDVCHVVFLDVCQCVCESRMKNVECAFNEIKT